MDTRYCGRCDVEYDRYDRSHDGCDDPPKPRKKQPNMPKTTDSRPVFVRRESCLLRIAELDAQLERLVQAKAEARAALVEIDRECGERPTIPAPAAVMADRAFAFQDAPACDTVVVCAGVL